MEDTLREPAGMNYSGLWAGLAPKRPVYPKAITVKELDAMDKNEAEEYMYSINSIVWEDDTELK
ncbi:hypothetical protein KIPB_016773, partial [Kipferlia bialata]|eukprot:g16773.t1